MFIVPLDTLSVKQAVGNKYITKNEIHIYEELSKADISWSKVFLTLVDDRLVGPSHEDSNQNLLYKHLIKNKAKVIKFFPLDDKVRFNKDFIYGFFFN